MATRLISAAVAILIGIVVLIFSNTILFNIVLAAISGMILGELFTAEKCWEHKVESTICVGYSVIMQFLVILPDMFWRYLVSIFCIFLIFVIFIVSKNRLTFDKICFMIATSVMVTCSISCISLAKSYSDIHGVCFVVLILAGAWIGDAGAYFVGTFLGKHKLCPDISPKKTVEGAVGGIVTTGIIFVIYAYVYRRVQLLIGVEDFQINYLLIALLGMICATLGMLGDLSASLIKRQNNIKDFGNIMPGHGGVMDRFDSVLFVAPFMAVALRFINVFY